MELNILFPSHIIVENNKPININLLTPFENIIKIDEIEYIPYYLDNLIPGNRGGNSHVIKLVNAQDFDEGEGYPLQPTMILKMCRFWCSNYNETNKSQMLKREIDALVNCNKNELPNTISVFNHGLLTATTNTNFKRKFRYYTMPYAPYELSAYLVKSKLEFSQRIDLCIEICESLRQIWKLGYYHRDIKPDNILFTEDMWVLSDLGLVEHRDEDVNIIKKGEWIGPRGWMSPESMNKFLAEDMPWSKLFDNRIDHQSDIFQLGKVFWYILQGNAPEGSIRRDDFKWKNDQLYQVIRTMLNHKKASRYKNISDVIIDLKKISAKTLLKGEPSYLY